MNRRRIQGRAMSKRRRQGSVKVLVPAGAGNPDSVYWVTSQEVRELLNKKDRRVELVDQPEGSSCFVVRVLPWFADDFRRSQNVFTNLTNRSGGFVMNGAALQKPPGSSENSEARTCEIR